MVVVISRLNMNKISANTVANIKAAIYGIASATSSWAGKSSYFENSKAAGRHITDYGYRVFVTDLYRTAQVSEGSRLHGTRSTYKVTLREFAETMQTSIIHHQLLRVDGVRFPVKDLETKMIQLLAPVEKYLDIYLGEVLDRDCHCQRRDIVIMVKEEYRNAVSVSLKHSLYDKDLTETSASVTERRRREVFVQ